MATENNNNDHTSTVIIDGLTISSSMEIDTVDVPSPTPASVPASVSEQAPESSSDQAKTTASVSEPEPRQEPECQPKRQPNEITRAMMDFGFDFDLAAKHHMLDFIDGTIILAFDQNGKKITDPKVLGISERRGIEALRRVVPLCYRQTAPFTTESFLDARVHLEKFASRLERIHLEGHLFSLPWSIEMNTLWSRFINLDALILENNGMTSFPTVVFRLPKLKKLLLGRNPITTLDWTGEEVKNSNLVKIQLEKTKIQKLSKSLVWPSTLTCLDFDYVETLTEIECSFPRSLDELVLRGTRITDAPKGIHYLDSLVLDENPCLTVLHLEPTPFLTHLLVNRCANLTNIEFADHNSSRKLKFIGAINCNFDHIPPVFEKFTRSLQSVYFNGNRITEIPLWLRDATRLEKFSVCDNQITSFPEEIVAGLSKLKALDLSNNPKLSVLPVDAMCKHFQRLALCSIKGTGVSYDDGKKLYDHCEKQRCRHAQDEFAEAIGIPRNVMECVAGTRGENNGNDNDDESVECSIC